MQKLSSMKCFWDHLADCRHPEEAVNSRHEDEIPLCTMCIGAEIARQMRLLAARQS
jgi:hypothetical protein